MIWFKINVPGSLGSWCIKGTEKSFPTVDLSVPLMHHDPSNTLKRAVIKLRKTKSYPINPSDVSLDTLTTMLLQMAYNTLAILIGIFKPTKSQVRNSNVALVYSYTELRIVKTSSKHDRCMPGKKKLSGTFQLWRTHLLLLKSRVWKSNWHQIVSVLYVVFNFW